MREDLDESALRGDIKRLVQNINRFVRDGNEDKRSALLPFICDLVASAVGRDATTDHGSEGMRWQESSKQMFAVIKLKGGESLLRFIRETASAAADSTIATQWNKDRVRLEMGEHLSNFQAIGDIFAALMAQHGIKGPVPYELEEDETLANARFGYDPSRDITAGTCGKRGDGHRCDTNHAHVPLGSGVEAFRRIEDSALLDQRGAYLRAVLVVPLHPSLPALPVVVHPTCLRFDCPWILKSWDVMDALCEKALAGSLGPACQGHGADGAAPLFKAMIEHMLIKPGEGRFHLSAPGLVITGKLVVVDGKECVRDLHSQDPRHNQAKLYSVLDNSLKDFNFGMYVASHFDYRASASLAEKFGDKHGVNKRFLDRRDAQSKTGPYVLVARQMLECMSKAVCGNYGPKQPFEGFLAYGHLIVPLPSHIFWREAKWV